LSTVWLIPWLCVVGCGPWTFLSKEGETPFMVATWSGSGQKDIRQLLTTVALARGPVLHEFPSLKEIAARNVVLLLARAKSVRLA